MMARAAAALRSLAFYAAFYGGTLLLVLMALVAIPLSKSAFHSIVRGWARWHRWCMRVLLGIGVRVEGEVPRQGVLVAIKHESFFEAIDLPLLLDQPAVFLKVELARLPLWGFASRHYGNVAVERDQGAKALRAMRAAALERTAQGRPLVIFPEGTRVPHGTAPPLQSGFAGLYKLLGLRAMMAEAQRFASTGRPLAIFPEGTRIPHGQRPPLQSGFAGLYKLLGLPVVAVAVDSGPLYHRRWKRPGTITLRFGEALPPGLPRAEIEARVHAAINALNEPAARSGA